jgi:hypothetical protein
MDKYGNVWNRYRVYPPQILSPLRAVRHKCLDCCCESADEVKLCPVETCSLMPYRFGSYPEEHSGTRSVLKPIKEKCKDCMPEPFSRGQATVKDCEKKCCPKWPYRMGRNPSRKGRGGSPPESTRFEKTHGAQTHESGQK